MAQAERCARDELRPAAAGDRRRSGLDPHQTGPAGGGRSTGRAVRTPARPGTGATRAGRSLRRAGGAGTIRPADGRSRLGGRAAQDLVLQAVAPSTSGRRRGGALGERGAGARRAGRFVRLFVDEGAPMAELLSTAAAQGIRPDYAARLLAAFEAEARERPPARSTPGPSSPPNRSAHASSRCCA